jgi:hypothetical protein
MIESSASNNRTSFVVCGGFNNQGLMSRSMILSTAHSGEHANTSAPLTWNGNNDQLLEADGFIQKGAFPVSSKLLTAAFLRKHVRDEAKQALLCDLTQPRSELVAVQGFYNGLHIFDKTHRIWLTCDKAMK